MGDSFLQDFGDSIPGHGGITDRMDCQVDFWCFNLQIYSKLVIFDYLEKKYNNNNTYKLY
jgi:predicted CDP-diglyceride synthetase/phosphatidate cytidylyltransferase